MKRDLQTAITYLQFTRDDLIVARSRIDIGSGPGARIEMALNTLKTACRALGYDLVERNPEPLIDVPTWDSRAVPPQDKDGFAKTHCLHNPLLLDDDTSIGMKLSDVGDGK